MIYYKYSVKGFEKELKLLKKKEQLDVLANIVA